MRTTSSSLVVYQLLLLQHYCDYEKQLREMVAGAQVTVPKGALYCRTRDAGKVQAGQNRFLSREGLLVTAAQKFALFPRGSWVDVM